MERRLYGCMAYAFANAQKIWIEFLIHRCRVCCFKKEECAAARCQRMSFNAEVWRSVYHTVRAIETTECKRWNVLTMIRCIVFHWKRTVPRHRLQSQFDNTTSSTSLVLTWWIWRWRWWWYSVYFPVREWVNVVKWNSTWLSLKCVSIIFKFIQQNPYTHTHTQHVRVRYLRCVTLENVVVLVVVVFLRHCRAIIIVDGIIVRITCTWVTHPSTTTSHTIRKLLKLTFLCNCMCVCVCASCSTFSSHWFGWRRRWW